MVVDIQPLQSQNSDSIMHSLQIPTNDYMYFSNTYLFQKKRLKQLYWRDSSIYFYSYPDWYNDNIGIRLWKKRFRDGKSNSTYKGIVIVYKNVSSFLPNVYVKELE